MHTHPDPISNTVELTVITDQVERADIWLTAQLSACSRAAVQKLIRDGHVLVDGRPTRANRRLLKGQVVTICPPAIQPARARPEDLPLKIIYQDRDIILIDKDPGMVVHPAAGHAGGTLVNALLHHCPDLEGIGNEMRPGIVHRLDRDTSGVMIVAKNAPSMQALAIQFKERQVQKEYLALVRGRPPDHGRADAPIGRHPVHRKKMAPVMRGRPATTEFVTLEAFQNAALLRVKIHTGRTHQIRVHLAHLGYPVLGDAVYGRGARRGDAPAPARQMLHAARLTFHHPRTGEKMTVSAPMPPDMADCLKALPPLR